MADNTSTKTQESLKKTLSGLISSDEGESNSARVKFLKLCSLRGDRGVPAVRKATEMLDNISDKVLLCLSRGCQIEIATDLRGPSVLVEFIATNGSEMRKPIVPVNNGSANELVVTALLGEEGLRISYQTPNSCEAESLLKQPNSSKYRYYQYRCGNHQESVERNHAYTKK